MAVEIRYKVVKLQLDLLWNAANSAVDDESKELEFKARYQEFPQIKEFTDSYISVEACQRAGFDAAKHLQEYMEYDLKMNQVSMIFCRLFLSGSSASATVVSDGISQSQGQDLPLPRILLPSFAGDITGWTNFINIFKNLIDENGSMKPVRKLHYLLSCLSKEAHDLVKHLH